MLDVTHGRRPTQLVALAVFAMLATFASPAAAQEVVRTCGGLPVTHVVSNLPEDERTTEGDDVVIIEAKHTNGNGHVWTLGGNDTICVRGGEGLVIHAGDGDDVFPLQTAIGVSIRMDAGNDVGYFDARWTSINGGPGNDHIEGSRAIFEGGAGDDTLISWADDHGATISGGPGDDLILGSNGADRLNGGGGNDILRGFAGTDRLSGGPGDDQLMGGPGNDTLRGDEGGDTLFGGKGDDLLGATVTDRHPGDPAVVPDTAGSKLYGGEGNDVLLGGTRWDRMTGGPGSDVLAGFEGQDRLRGGPGDDRLFGGANADTLLGNTGADRLYTDPFDSGSGGYGIDSCIGSIRTSVRCERQSQPTPAEVRVGQAASVITIY